MTGLRDRIIELYELGLSLDKIATRVGYYVNTIQLYIRTIDSERSTCTSKRENDDHQRIRQQPGERYEPTRFAELPTSPTPSNMFDHCTPLVHIGGHLTVNHYVSQVVEPVVLPLLYGALNIEFHQDDSRPHVARRTLNSLIAFNILLWWTKYLDPNPYPILRNIVGHDLN
ncbi:hypothetical protein TNCV_1312331 [Trichonephila clavipes]|nr:hypothetical protein TNCV_1312331 [Trichonephila clavipes]